MRIVVLLPLTLFGVASWASGCVVRADPIPIPGETAEPAEQSCTECVQESCGEILAHCKDDENCDAVKECVAKCDDGDPGCVAGCAAGLADVDHMVSTYKGIVSSCTADRCGASSCEAAADYCGLASFVGVLHDLYPGGKNTCEQCLREKCCDVGLECGMDPMCWQKAACAFTCLGNNVEECGTCKAKFGAGMPEIYDQVMACKVEHCDATMEHPKSEEEPQCP